MKTSFCAEHVRRVVIAGGGTAGWMAAAYLGRILGSAAEITLIESPEIGSVGVGEATIPHIQVFHHDLGVDEATFMKATNATFKLGIDFKDWGNAGESYIHGFGTIGQDIGNTKFHEYWLYNFLMGGSTDYERISLNAAAARKSVFIRDPSTISKSLPSSFGYAYHFDASLYAAFLSKYSKTFGVRHVEGKIAKVTQRQDNGFIESLVLDDGHTFFADLFIDCTGFRGLLIEQTLKTGYDDWSYWLPCDSAWAVPCASVGELLPYTKSSARSAGWQWRIPLQHRVGNGHVFSSSFTRKEDALNVLTSTLEGAPLAEPRLLRFVTGKRRKIWNKNVVSLGLASGFLEPLESTSIHLIQSTLARLVVFFPDMDFDPVVMDAFNRATDYEFERIRDFLVAHYCVTRRDDTEFWRHCRTMSLPDSLAERIALFRKRGQIYREANELFTSDSWFQVLFGQGLKPDRVNPLFETIGSEKIRGAINNVELATDRLTSRMVSHREFLETHGMLNA
jgi:tryptophan halogenase